MTRYQRKMSIAAIQAATGHDRKTIQKVVTPGTDGNDRARRSRGSKLDSYHEYIRKRWDEGCQNAQVLWEELCDQGFTGSLSLVKQRVAPLRPQRGVEPTQRYETAPGEQAQCDWADFGALVYPDGRRPLYIFIYTMSYSRRMYIEFVHDERQETLFACLEHAFAYFGCVPATVLSDNMKPMVVEHPPDGDIVWNPRFAAFAAFHGFRPKAARPYRAKTKGKVERAVKYVRQNFWPRVPDAMTLAELNTRVLQWAEQRDHRIHGTTHARPCDRWADDYAASTPYDPTHLWIFGEPFERKVTADAFVHWQGHRFAVPWEAAGHPVQVFRQPEDQILIRQGERLWAHYAVPTAPHQEVGTLQYHTTPPPHRVPGVPTPRRRDLHVPDLVEPTTRSLDQYAEVMPS